MGFSTTLKGFSKLHAQYTTLLLVLSPFQQWQDTATVTSSWTSAAIFLFLLQSFVGSRLLYLRWFLK